MRVRDFRFLTAILKFACFSALAAVSAAQTPGLVAQHFSIDLKQSDALARADDAITAAGLTADPPTAISRGGRKQYITVLIHCIAQEKVTLIDLEVAEVPCPESNAYQLRAFLTSFMQTGKASMQSGFTGEWDAVDGSTHRRMILTQDGNRVTGTYEGGGTKGTIEGTLNGNVLTFRWKQANGNTGTGKYTLAADGSSFSGAWSYGDDPEKADKPWSATRIGAAPTGVPASAAPTFSAGKGFAGEWATKCYGGTAGKIVINTDGTHVTGRYEGTGNGTIEGTISGRDLRFTWTESNGSKGTGKFTLSDDESTFKGLYSYDPDPDKGDRYWNGQRPGAPPAGAAGGTSATPSNKPSPDKPAPDKPASDKPAPDNPPAAPPPKSKKELPALGPTLSPPGYEDKHPIDAFPSINLSPAPLPLPGVGADSQKRGTEKKTTDPIKIARITCTHKPEAIHRGYLEVNVDLSRPAWSECCVDIYVGGYLQTSSANRSFCNAYCMATLMSSKNFDQHYTHTFAVPDVLPATVRAELVAFGSGQVLDQIVDTFTAPFPDLLLQKVVLWGDAATRRWESGAAFVTGNVPEDREVIFNNSYKRDPTYVPIPKDPWEVGPSDWIIGRKVKGGGTPVDNLPTASKLLEMPASGSIIFFRWGPNDMSWPSSRPGIDNDSGQFDLWVSPTGVLDGRKAMGFQKPNRGYDPSKLVNMQKSLDP